MSNAAGFCQCKTYLFHTLIWNKISHQPWPKKRDYNLIDIYRFLSKKMQIRIVDCHAWQTSPPLLCLWEKTLYNQTPIRIPPPNWGASPITSSDYTTSSIWSTPSVMTHEIHSNLSVWYFTNNITKLDFSEGGDSLTNDILHVTERYPPTHCAMPLHRALSPERWCGENKTIRSIWLEV